MTSRFTIAKGRDSGLWYSYKPNGNPFCHHFTWRQTMRCLELWLTQLRSCR